MVSFFKTRLLTFAISFSTTANADVVVKALILGISVMISFIFVLRMIFVAKVVISGILSSIF